jgi:hypothetical protein
MNLYDISKEYRDAAEKLADMDLDEQTIADTLESISGDLEVKAQNIVFFARNMEATAASIKEAEANMAARRKAMENRAEGLRRYLLGSLQYAGISKVECPYFKIAVQDNPPAVDVFEPALLPSEYMRQPEPPPPAPDKAAIKDALKAGKDVPGARLVQGKRLAIK